MSAAIKLIGTALALSAFSSVLAQGVPPPAPGGGGSTGSGGYTISEPQWSGSKTWTGQYIGGSWSNVPTTTSFHNATPLPLMAGSEIPAGTLMVSKEDWMVTVNVTWTGAGTPPQTCYLKLSPSAMARYSYCGSGSSVSADNGSGDGNAITSSAFGSEGSSFGTHYIKLSGQTSYSVSLRIKAEARGTKLGGAPISEVNTLTTLSASISDRSVELITELGDTAYRSGPNASSLNLRDAAGTLIADTAVELLDTNVSEDGVPTRGGFDVEIYRILGGGWHQGALNLKNEWWYGIPSEYVSDGNLSEIEWVPLNPQFGPTETLKLADLLSGPVTFPIGYRVTDAVDGNSAKANLFVRAHLPVEKVAMEQEYSGDLDVCPWPEVSSTYTAMQIASIQNTNLQSGLPVIQVEVSDERTYTYEAKNTMEGGVILEINALKLNFGGKVEKSTSDQWKKTAKVSVGPYLVPIGKKLVVSAVPMGTAKKWRCSKWGAHGYEADGKCLDVRSDSLPFALRFEVK